MNTEIFNSRTIIRNLALLSLPLLFMMASCEQELIGPQVTNTPTKNFEYFWKTFDSHYGMFDAKGIKWDEIFAQNRPRINDQLTDAELYAVLIGMMNVLNDNHLNLYPTNGELPVYPGGIFRYTNGKAIITKVQEDYDLEVVKRYLISYEQVTPNIGYGRLPDGLSYVNVKGTDGLKTVEKQMEKVMAFVADSKGVVIDIRAFYGGFDPVSQYVAGCFASSKKLYMTTRKRNGPAHSDFTNALEWYVEPQSTKPYTQPVIVITSPFTQSAGESFELALIQFDHVQTLGDTTAGSFSDNPNFELPNGWIFSVSVGDYRASDGKSYEGIGLVPDVLVNNRKEDLMAGKDNMLEKAMELLNK
jgi:carboxyl-terminal processing protease